MPNPGTVSTIVNARDCSACTEGTDYQDQPGQSTCIPVTICFPGEEVAQSALVDKNRLCDPCDAGKFSGTTNAETCTNCPAGFYQDQPGQDHCKALTICQPGSEESTGPRDDRDRGCTICPAGKYSNGINEGGCSTCPSDTWAPANSSACIPWHEECDALTEFESIAPTRVNDRVCESIVTCVPGQFVVEDLDVDELSNRVCHDCGQGEYSDTDNSPTCTSCILGVSYQAGQGRTSCHPVRTCSPGQHVSSNPTLLSNRQCSACPPGWISAVENAIACSPCDGQTGYAAADQTKCTPVTRCHPGERVLVPPSQSSDRLCTVCLAGTVSAQENSFTCTVCDGVTGFIPTSNGQSCLPISPPCLATEVQVCVSGPAGLM